MKIQSARGIKGTSHFLVTVDTVLITPALCVLELCFSWRLDFLKICCEHCCGWFLAKSLQLPPVLSMTLLSPRFKVNPSSGVISTHCANACLCHFFLNCAFWPLPLLLKKSPNPNPLSLNFYFNISSCLERLSSHAICGHFGEYGRTTGIINQDGPSLTGPECPSLWAAPPRDFVTPRAVWLKLSSKCTCERLPFLPH